MDGVLGGPHPPRLLLLCYLSFSLPLMSEESSIAHIMSEIMHRLQYADIIDDEEDFLVLIEENFMASQEENRCNC